MRRGEIYKRDDGAMHRLGKVSEMDRSFDLVYWQSRPATERFDAVWDMVVFNHELKQRDPDELRLDRTAETLGRRAD